MNIFNEIKRMQKEISRMQENMDKMFKGFLKPMHINFEGFKQPASDVKISKNNVIVKVEMPGIDKKDIQLVVRDNFLEVKAQRKSELREEKKDFYRQERSYKGFYRAIALPVNVKAEDASAEYKNGVLTVTIPRKEKALAIKAKKIKVR
ncbi:MAG: Hsp20/alpha crystallin family protein [Nanoarchaeota archaeon]